jgi:hypothetical protein
MMDFEEISDVRKHKKKISAKQLDIGNKYSCINTTLPLNSHL